jgi:hypothetical protein
MRYFSFAKLVLPLAAGLLASACATSPPQGLPLAQDPPWWESAEPCRIWVPMQPAPGRIPAWHPGPSTSRMSNPGDCRSLQAALPDGSVLIGSN